jgi:hypothetical protein
VLLPLPSRAVVSVNLTWCSQFQVSRTNAAQAYAFYGKKPQTMADHKLMAQYNSQAAVLGSSTAAQVRGSRHITAYVLLRHSICTAETSLWAGLGGRSLHAHRL